MKKKILILILIIASAGISFYSFSSNNDCCATCSGNKICNACKNCNYCKHCSKNGGECGVCSPKSFEIKKTVIKKDTIINKPKKSMN